MNAKQNTSSPDLPADQPLPTYHLFGLAILVGIISGLGAIVFRNLISLVVNFSFTGNLNFINDGNNHIPTSIWGVGVILIPVLGALLVTWLTHRFAPEAKGHGVPEVLYAIHHENANIRPIVAVIKALASAISIGTGGSVGREGPIIQIGAAVGATLGQIIAMPASQRIILIAAGGGAGLAATFNAPLTGVAFAIELMLVSITTISVGLVTAAVVTAIMVVYVLNGNQTLFIYDMSTQILNFSILSKIILLCIPLGILLGLSCSGFIYFICWIEDVFNKFLKNPYLRHALGMLGVGILFYLFMIFYGYYYVAGVGYSTIQDLLINVLTDPWLLILLFVGKFVATGLTLGSGGSGGIFSPALFLGATLGAFYGILVNWMFPGVNIEPTMFALAGMAGMIGGITGTFITAVLMIFEITQDYTSLLPMMLTVAIADMVRVYFSAETIYTLKLKRQGYILPCGLQARFNKDE